MKKALKIIVNVLAWVLLVFALIVTLAVFSSGKNNGVANLMGFIPMTVESDSMKPTFKTDDMIICKEVDDVNDLKVDDVITFWTIIDGNKVKNTHRIVEINESNGTRSFVTKGDNNDIADESTVQAGDLIGKWTGAKIPGFGKVMRFLGTQKGFFICILIPMALFFLFELYKFIATLIELKKPQISEDDEEEIKRRAIEEYLAAQKAKEGSEEGADAKEEPKAKEEAQTEEEKSENTETPEDEPQQSGEENGTSEGKEE